VLWFMALTVLWKFVNV